MLSSINQSVNQSINQSVNQSINQSIIQSINHSINGFILKNKIMTVVQNNKRIVEFVNALLRILPIIKTK